MNSPPSEQSSEPKYTNRLIHETSPYLQQHAHNPVDWYPWGEEALERARREDKPILLSIGYSTCHWCHVMERESFENEEIARLMNEYFINIKVDREERPDLDAIYMNVVQMLTGSGGWPMTVFLTPDGEPFFAGTYFPPEDRYGMPGFRRVLLKVAELYRTRRDDLMASAREIVRELNRISVPPPTRHRLGPEILDQAYESLVQQFDAQHGGFGRAPKFPSAMNLIFLLRHYQRTKKPGALEMVELSLTRMARGGIYDQLGGGFHRYATDERWLVPHFEKMLYDNALLSRLYLYAYQVTGNEFYRRIAEETLTYVVREMRSPEGGFYSAQDADSEGVEGKFFVWTPEEIKQVLGEREGELFCQYYDVTPWGNFEHGRSILHVPREIDIVARSADIDVASLRQIIERGRTALFHHREKRIKPHRDEKIITSWNGLMLRSFAEAASILDREDFRQIATNNAEFLLTHLRRDGRLQRTYRGGVSKLNAYLEDYALFADGLLALYEATGDWRWLDEATSLVETMIEQFWDDEEGGFYFTARDHEPLIARMKEFYDNAIPSGNSVAADVLLRLAHWLDKPEYYQRAERLFELVGDAVRRFPGAFGHLLGALDFYFSSPREIAIVGDKHADDTRALLRAVFERFLPNKVVALKDPREGEAARRIPWLKDREPIAGRATAYVCQNFSCQAPVTDVAALVEQLS
ncbi:MAG: thioredoxin domain-containing protein [Acidobacteria bacterium]|nr:MAG: thioredoxin domain-containing protein [Acidobacteriota bacterium]